MSSQKIQISSNEQFSDKANHTGGNNNDDMLHPNWGNLRRRDVKSKAKSTCGIQKNEESEVDQVLFFKQKAHQSFMQVIQVQQLHEQQIQLLKEGYEHTIVSLQNQLKQKNQMIEALQKNANQNILDLQYKIDSQNLGLIQCKENNFTRFDESAIFAFKDFLSQQQSDTKIQSLRQNVFTCITNEITKYITNPEDLMKNIKSQINSIFEYLKEVREQLFNKVQIHEALLKKYQEIDSNHKKLKSMFEIIQKDASFMADNLKIIKEEKANLQRKNTQLERKIIEMEKQIRIQQNSKEALLKMSLRENNATSLFSRNMLSSQKNIVKNAPGRLIGYKSHFDLQANKSKGDMIESNNEQNLMESTNVKNLSKNEESFDVQDLIAEINRNEKISKSPLNNQKRSQLMVSVPLSNRIRRKSFDN